MDPKNEKKELFQDLLDEMGLDHRDVHPGLAPKDEEPEEVIVYGGE